MTAQFRTLSDLEGDIQYRFSAAGLTARHSSPRVRQLFNVAWQTMREEVSLVSDGSYLEGGAVTALPTTAAVTGEVYAEVDWPVDAIGVYGVRVKVGQRWYPLRRIPFAAYQDYQYASFLEPFLRAPGPAGYTSVLLPDGDEDTTTSEKVGKIMIVPIPQSGSYRLWYLKPWLPRTADDAVFPGHSTQTEFAIHDTLIKMLGPDKNAGGMYDIWSKERDRCLNLVKARASSQMGDDVLEPRNARGDGWDLDITGEVFGG